MANAEKKAEKTKICDICGDSGFMEDIVTCHCCKRASEHIYCMQVLQFRVPDVWYCNGCLSKAHGVHEGKMQDTRTESDSFKICTFDSKRAKSPTKVSTHLNDDPTPEEINDGRKQQNRRHPMHSSSSNVSVKTIENAKVKFITLEEVALNYGATAYCKQGNSGVSCRRSVCPFNSRKSFTSISRSRRLTSTRVPRQPNEATVDTDTDLSLGKAIIVREDIINDKEGNMQKNKVSDYNSSLKSIVPAASNISSDASKHIDDRTKNRTKCKALGETSATPTEEKHMDRSIVASDYFQLKHIQEKEAKCVDVGVQPTRDRNKKIRTYDTSGGIVCSAAQCKILASKENDLPLTLLINPNEKLLNCPAPGTCWKGTFEVFDMGIHIYGEIQAHFPSQVSPKAYDISKKLPVKLKLDMLPRRDAWPKIFQSDPPTYDDIGLYFFPSQLERPKEKYFRLLERIDSCDFAMQTWIDDVELLIYPSQQLTVDSHRINEQIYLWGVFRHVKQRKHHQHRQEFSSLSPAAADLKTNKHGPSNTSFECSNEEVDMEIDMEGGKDIGQVDKPIRKRVVPPGLPFESPILQEAGPACRPLVKLLDKTSSAQSDVPPGFSRTPYIKQESFSPVVNQIHPVSKICDSPSSFLDVSQRSGTVLALFPPKSEDGTINKADDGETRQPISADLSLSMPHYVMDGDSWVSMTPKVSLDQDGCGEKVQLKL
ncbi:unnamed protein product [Musa acuminata subsp. burmannicoides]